MTDKLNSEKKKLFLCGIRATGEREFPVATEETCTPKLGSTGLPRLRVFDMDKFVAEKGSFADAVSTVRDVVGDTIDEPFYTVNLADVVRKVKMWNLKLPRVTPFYAIKCNPDPVILKLLASLQTGFDCASKAEIETVLNETGVDPTSRIIYANPCKTKSFVTHARKRGVTRMTFDNFAELDKIAEVFPESELVLRIKVDDSQSVMQFSCKFGADLEIVPELLEYAFDLGLNVVGVSFHVGSGCCNPKSFTDAIINAEWVFKQASSVGYDMTLLDIGGGFPGNTGCEDLFDQCAGAINAQLDESFPEDAGIKIIAEPGRFMVASAFTLYTTVIAKRRSIDDNQFEYYLNDGVYGSFNCKIFDHADPQPMTLIDRSSRESNARPNTPCVSYNSVLWGPTCDSLDKIHDSVRLPEMRVGEWLAFSDMGAYTVSAASNFNGFSKPSLKYIVNDHTETILSRTILGRELMSSLQVTTENDPLGNDQLKMLHTERLCVDEICVAAADIR